MMSSHLGAADGGTEGSTIFRSSSSSSSSSSSRSRSRSSKSLGSNSSSSSMNFRSTPPSNVSDDAPDNTEDMVLEEQVTVVIISSPTYLHPSTTFVEQVISSFQFIEGLDQCKVIIVLDGYHIRSAPRTKKGQITIQMCAEYDQYHQNLTQLYGHNPRYRIIRSQEHLGFSMCVRWGLQNCTTTYALIAQHDRIFVAPFTRITDLLRAMRRHTFIRYIGFPTATSRTHDSLCNTRYRILWSEHPEVKLELGQDLLLQPLIFWFDSQHLCHVKRYLDIYSPFTNLPDEVKSWLGDGFVKDMVLRKGDFIEDRFGQMQRRCLTKGGKSDEFMKKVFLWFGSYLAWVPDPEGVSGTLAEGCLYRSAQVLVGHLRGRQTKNAATLAAYMSSGSKRLDFKAYVNEYLEGLQNEDDDPPQEVYHFPYDEFQKQQPVVGGCVDGGEKGEGEEVVERKEGVEVDVDGAVGVEGGKYPPENPVP